MKKILIIIQREFMTRVSKKSFILLTIFMPFIFATLIFLPLWLAGIESDEQRTVMVADKTGSYVHLFEDSKNYRFVPTAETDNAAFYSDSSDIEAKVVLNLNALVFRRRKEMVMQYVEEKDRDPEELQKLPGITCYFVKPGDTLWDIAKKFYTTTDKIRKLNELKTETLTPMQQLLVERV